METTQDGKGKGKQGTGSGGGRRSIGNTIGLVLVAGLVLFSLWNILFAKPAPPGGSETRPATLPPLAAVPAPATASAPVSTTSSTPGSTAPTLTPIPGGAAGLNTPPPTRTGQPWEYDAPTNKHWNPLPGHGHWHAGPPPPEGQRTAGAAGQPVITPQVLQAPAASPGPTRTGQPWEFDAATNKHWNPLPGHDHWHSGPPPPVEQRGN